MVPKARCAKAEPARPIRYSPQVVAGLHTIVQLVKADLMAYEESDRQDSAYVNALLALAWLGEEMTRRARRRAAR